MTWRFSLILVARSRLSNSHEVRLRVSARSCAASEEAVRTWSAVDVPPAENVWHGRLDRAGSTSHSFAVRSRSAFAITETELNDMASAATIGLRSSPNTGYRAPAAMGMPMTL